MISIRDQIMDSSALLEIMRIMRTQAGYTAWGVVLHELGPIRRRVRRQLQEQVLAQLKSEVS